MNPFLYDTVAKPLSEPELAKLTYAAKTSCRAGMIALMTVAGMGSLSAHALDVNAASADELQKIKGVGPRTAQIIVQERQRAGHFESMQDLSERVRGIGLKKLQTMQQAGLSISASTGGSVRRVQEKNVRSTIDVDPVVTEVN